MVLWTSGIILLDYFIIPFLASEYPKHISLSRETGKSDILADLTDCCLYSLFSPTVTFLEQMNIHLCLSP